MAHLLRQAVRLAAQEITDLDGINVYVAQDCAGRCGTGGVQYSVVLMCLISLPVYIQDILDECTVPATPAGAPWQRKGAPGGTNSSASTAHTERSGATSCAEGDEDVQSAHWKSLILLVPLRLGTDKLNPIYNECLKAMLSLDYCIGIIGGRPKHSLYFVGYQGKATLSAEHTCAFQFICVFLLQRTNSYIWIRTTARIWLM